MSKENARKATFKDLLAKKLQKEKDSTKVKDIYVESIDSTITCMKPNDDLFGEVIDEIGTDKKYCNMVSAFKKLIFHTCKMFQDVEFQNELGVKDPYDSVSAVFESTEIVEIGGQIMDMCGVAEEQAEKLKN